MSIYIELHRHVIIDNTSVQFVAPSCEHATDFVMMGAATKMHVHVGTHSYNHQNLVNEGHFIQKNIVLFLQPQSSKKIIKTCAKNHGAVLIKKTMKTTQENSESRQFPWEKCQNDRAILIKLAKTQNLA